MKVKPTRKLGPNGYKLCKHGHERTPDNVAKNRSCRECARLAFAQYRKENPDKIKETTAKHYKKNATKLCADSNAYNKRNAERRRDYMLEYFKQNPEKKQKEVAEKVRERETKNRVANPTRFRLKNHKRRARKKEVGGELSKDIASKLMALQKGKCRICRKKLNGEKYHLDHIVPLAKGGQNSDNNVQILCPSCNCRKGSKEPHIYAQRLGMLFL